MSLPNKVLPGFAASLWCQTGATPTALTTANLATWTGQVGDIVGTVVVGIEKGEESANGKDVVVFCETRHC